MRVLFNAAGTSPASVFAIAPLATAVRNAGHEILVTSFEEMAPAVESVGLPPAPFVTRETTESIKDMADRPTGRLVFPPPADEELAYSGGWFARQAAVSLPGLRRLAEDWRPDLVVGGTLAYGPALLAAERGIPHVRQMWDWVDFRTSHPYAEKELRPELAEAGLAGLPEPDLTIDICPPSLRPADAPDDRLMRWVPGNRQKRLEPWMYTRGDRPRVCVTLGSFRVSTEEMFDYLCGIVESVSALEAEIVVAATEEVAVKLRERFPGIRSGWVPMEFLADTCELVVHHSGGLTAMACMSTGTPQLVLNQFDLYNDSLRRLQDHGSGEVLYRGEHSVENVRSACEKLLSDPAYRRRAQALRAEMAELPTPGLLVGEMERLTVR
ncbi:glycosyltransferase [Streptomyces iconiensis]|uniref:Glycosyltransferase n=1 Tax=Streptomyces iconiensis TaxID=1384038 RepID=A0ABT7A1Q4_9ACTN|nr:glycosyltransferase [Streptomyces iconiensis]MDJ1134994.1 glycosyltransferase [Streptomyces iconiensis]